MRSRRHATLALAILALLAASCGGRDEPAIAAGSAREDAGAREDTGAREGAGRDAEAARLREARTLALATPPGDGPLDRQIAELRQRLEAGGAAATPDAFADLGALWVRLARRTADPGFFLNAEACADIALASAPRDAAALHLKGMALLSAHRFAEARDLARGILAGAPDDRLVWGTLSDAELELGNLPGAVLAANEMMARRPDLPSYSRAAYLKWLQGDVDGSLASWEQAADAGLAARDPEPASWALVQHGTVLWHEGRLPEAAAHFERARLVMGDDGYPPALVGLGRIAMAEGRPGDAAALLDRAHAASPLPETAWLLGDARAAAGDAAGARRAHDVVRTKGRSLDPRTLALFLATRREDPELAVDLASAELRTRGDVYTHDAHAWASLRGGRLAEARASIERALVLGTRDATLWYHAGMIRLASGDDTGGRDLLRRALALNPAFDATGAAEAREALGSGRD